MPGYDKTRIIGLSEKELDGFCCGICKGIFNNPVMPLCCRQTYCKVCIEQWLSTETTCPNDKSLLTVNELIPVPRFVVNDLYKMQIKCDYEEKGCPVITTIGELPRHLDNCGHKPNWVNLVKEMKIICQEVRDLQDKIKNLVSSFLCDRVAQGALNFFLG